jgi:hypothetical protein
MKQNANNAYGTIFALRLFKRPPIKYSSGAVRVRFTDKEISSQFLCRGYRCTGIKNMAFFLLTPILLCRLRSPAS